MVMSKSNATENDFIKFVFLATAMPNYGANLQLNFHTADPGEAGTATTSEPTPTAYLPKPVVRDATGWTVCDADGTPNANGSAAKSAIDVLFDEIEPGFVGTETWTHGSVSVVATGQILYSGALGQAIIVSALSAPYFPAGTVLFRED
jgi:hypothetical protein